MVLNRLFQSNTVSPISDVLNGFTIVLIFFNRSLRNVLGLRWRLVSNVLNESHTITDEEKKKEETS